jgi:4-diphosphocytidyl-2-C-methyl-D-erythritol kinase
VFAEDIGDTVTVVANARERLAVDGPFADALRSTEPADNLVLRAANLFFERRRQPLSLVKRIPVAAGMGGGSADAAATLRLLNRVLDVKLTQERMVELGRVLGADVPMCVISRPLIARGIGEAMTPVVGLPSLPLALACPPVGVNTSRVFGAVTEPGGAPLPPVPRFASVQDVATWLQTTRNDLSEPASRLFMAATAAAKALAASPDCLFARMTGSGPAAFGLFSSAEAARVAAAHVAAAQPSWWVRSAVTGAS